MQWSHYITRFLPAHLIALTGCLFLDFGSSAFAQTDDLRLPVSLDADSTAYDGKSSMVMFRGLRLTQGRFGISADEGFASQMDFEDSTWHFEGNIIIDVENGHIESDVADMEFSGYQLKTATISGSPATFEMRRPGNDNRTYAEAGKLVYDFVSGVIEFSGQATIMEGGNQISSSYLVYNIQEQRINASSSGTGDPKVRITYTPGALDELAEDALNEAMGGGDDVLAPDPQPETGEPGG
ncbi:MAG: LptA/OstA family protein [Woeseiaceae bacterium]|nr:LptA/OstA family protein [Woeseiaceae bacterium]